MKVSADTDSVTFGNMGITNVTDTGYDIGCWVWNKCTVDMHIEFQTYTIQNGKDDLCTYDGKEYKDNYTNQYGDPDNCNWSYHVSAKEHNNEYGLYETDIYEVKSDGSSALLAKEQADITPIVINSNYMLEDNSTINVKTSIKDDINGSIVSQKWASGNQVTGYFLISGTGYTGNSFEVSEPGVYTVYAKDSEGYENTSLITVSSCYGQTPQIFLNQNSTAPTRSAVVNALCVDTSNLYNNQAAEVCENSITRQGSNATIQDVSDITSGVPNTAAKTWLWSKDGGAKEWCGYEGSFGGIFNANAGDWYLFIAYDKSTDVNSYLTGTSFYLLNWAGFYSTSTIEQYHNTSSDGNWHLNYGIVQANEAFNNAIACDAISWDYISAPGSMYINDINWIKIPAGQDISTGIIVKKWAYGDQPVSFFATAGNTFTGTSFNVSQNGIVTVYAKNAEGKEITETITISNVNPYYGDTTPPTTTYTLTPSARTSGNVTINLVASDSDSGVKSIMLPDGSTVNQNAVSYTARENGNYNFVITDNAGNTTTKTVPVTNICRTVTMTHPINSTYAIDPNGQQPFNAPDIQITNHSSLPVKVILQSFGQCSGSNKMLNDVSPEKYSNWDTLTAAQTKSDIALSIGIQEKTDAYAGWNEIDQKAPVYTASLNLPVQLGVLAEGGTGHLCISGKAGLAWDANYTDMRQLVLIFQVT